MKHLVFFLIFILLVAWLGGCSAQTPAQVVATTLPVYEFSARICEGTDITVTRLITENVSCLHDYTLQVKQMQAIEQAEVVVLSGAGLEDFLTDALSGAVATIDTSYGVNLFAEKETGHDHDPHIWLSPVNAKVMAKNIADGLSAHFPEESARISANLASLLADLDALESYGKTQLESLSTRELITFHDGFGYFAQAFDLTILEAVEEESGSEASAAELAELITLVTSHNLPAVFTEINGSDAAASVLATETGCKIFTLDMAMSGSSYLNAMYHNIDTLREALQ